MTRAFGRLVLLLALGANLTVSGCSQTDAPAVCVSEDGGEPISPALLAFLSRARSGHHIADQLETAEPQRAIQTLEAIVQGSKPSGDFVEAREVLADTRARLADLKSQAGRFDEALKDIEAGLTEAREVSYFQGHLFEVRGLVEERRAVKLKADGDTDGAAQAKARALTAFEASMNIQEQVIERALPEGGAP